jgi:four helix bundle protein
MMPFEKLEAWQAAHQLAVGVYHTTASFPKSELYGLTSQLRRAAFSIPANIAEGSAKRGKREFRRFLDIALGSFAELTYGIRFARDVGVLSRSQFDDLERLRLPTGRITWGLYRAVAHLAPRP